MTPKELLADSTIVGVRRTARMTVFGHDDQDGVLVRPPSSTTTARSKSTRRSARTAGRPRSCTTSTAGCSPRT